MERENRQERMESARPFLTFGFTPFVWPLPDGEKAPRALLAAVIHSSPLAAETYPRERETWTGQARALPDAIAFMLIYRYVQNNTPMISGLLSYEQAYMYK